MFVVFDLDGTLALIEHRVHHIRKDPKDYDAFFAACVDDKPNWPVIRTFCSLALEHNIEIWSGRSDLVKGTTLWWLEDRCSIPDIFLKRMRKAGDHQPDVSLKRSWLNEARAAGKAPDLVFDDRDTVVAMWREEGIPCFQVAPGPF